MALFRGAFVLSLWACFFLICFALPSDGIDHNISPRAGQLAHIPRQLPANGTSSLPGNVTESALDAARKIVKDAIAQAAVLNKARIQHPARNHWTLKPGTIVGNGTFSKRSEQGADAASTPPPLLAITPEIAAAAALVAEADAANVTVPAQRLKKRSSFWMENIARKGTSPWGNNASYKVFRNVKDYGAKGDGKTDDTKAIWAAMIDGKRCANGCNGASTLNAIVYFPSGTYLVSTNITVIFGTQVIGDATNLPTIKAASSFVGLGVLSTDVYVGNGAGADGKDNEWYINTASFYRQIRNIKIDITATDPNAYVAAIHYQVAQATSLQNVELIATTGTTQQGMYSENGSGGFMSDVTFTGGAFGFYGGNQQFTVQRLTFNGCSTAVQIIWDWGWVWKSITVNNADVGFMLDPNGGTGVIGSASIIDSVFTNVKKAIVIDKPSSKPNSGSTGLVLENVGFHSVSYGVVDTGGTMYLAGVNTLSYVLGPSYNGTHRVWIEDSAPELFPDATLMGNAGTGMPNAPYFERPRAQYETTPASGFVHLKDMGAKGDGSTDDTAAVQKAFNTAGNSIIFADAGVYVLTDTVTIPNGTRIVGEAWTQFAAYGSKFGNSSNPLPMLQVGNPGDVGSVEMQDIIFTTKGPTPGAVLVEWNIQAATQGSAALWDCHARLGGATGTSLTPKECPAYTDGTVNSACMTASLVMHLTQDSSGYFENMWLWTADHMLDDPDWTDDKNQMTQVSVFTARGMLIESLQATWLYGVASEHAVMYQFNFNGAQHVYAGLLQTESPYYQPKPSPPAPYKSAVGVYQSDPTYNCGNIYDGCDASWAVMLVECQNVHIAALGVYSWFNDYTQECVNPHNCQKALILIQNNYEEVRLENVITIGANTSIVADGAGIPALDNLAVSDNNASWSQISLYDVAGSQLPIDDEEPITCDWTITYNNLTDIENDVSAGKIDPYCAEIYSISTLGYYLSEALANYTASSGDYDDKFGYYVQYVKELIPSQIDACMYWEEATDKPGPCNQYFTCIYNANGHNSSSTSCPPPGLDFYSNPGWDTYYTLVNSTGFYAEMLNTYGIPQNWLSFGTKDTPLICQQEEQPTSCFNQDKNQHNYPVEASSITVPNPRDVFTNASNNFAALHATIDATYMYMAAGGWNGTNSDAASTFVVPVSMAVQAAYGMQQVQIIGGEVKDEDRKNLILEILGAVLMVLPFVGEALGGLGDLVASIGRILTIVDAVANTGLSVYNLIEHPEGAVMDIIGIMLGGIGLEGIGNGMGRASGEVKIMADARAADKDATDFEALGTEFSSESSTLGDIVKVACKA